MEKALKMGKASATGGFHLFIGMIASTIIKAAGTIILARLMSPVQFGLYAIALIPPLMIDLFRDWGVGPAMTKYIAQCRAENKNENVQDMIYAGLIFEVTSGTILSILSVFLGGIVASTILQRPEASFLVSIASMTIFFGSLLTASQSCFVGFERMKLNGITMICESVVRAILAPLLVIQGFGALGAIVGYTMGFLSAGVVGLALLYFNLLKSFRNTKVTRSVLSKTLKKLLHYGVPLWISVTIVSFLLQFYGFVMAFYLSDAIIGNYQAAANFAVLLTFVTFPISTVLLPAFAKINPQKEPQLLKSIYISAVKYTAMLLVPATMAMMVLSEPLIKTLLGEQWVYAPFLLTLYVANYLFAVFGFPQSMAGLLAGLGKTKIMMITSILTLLVGVPLAFLLIPTFGAAGAIIGSTISLLPKMLVGLHYIWKHYKVTLDWGSSAKIFFASAIAAAMTYLSLIVLNTSEWIRLVAGGTAFFVVYVVSIPFVRAVTQSDINNFRIMLSGLGLVSKIAGILLSFVEKIAMYVMEEGDK